ncbi:MAG TPA: hypothetical protein VF042_03100 [Gemmatimonadaceae bacterium]
MIPIFNIPDEPASRAAHRKFRTIVALLFVVMSIALILQYTYGLLPEAKTSTLWGMLAGFAAMALFVEWRWSKNGNRASR